MGGKLFGEYCTPRMPAEIYSQVKLQVHTAFLQHFSLVNTPIEGPAKKDYGDVDIFVALPSKCVLPEPSNAELAVTGPGQEYLASAKSILEPTFEELRQQLHAVQMHHTSMSTRSLSLSYCVPWPTETQDGNPVNSRVEPCCVTRYIQVDVTFMTTKASFDYQGFMHSHSDFVTILSNMLNPLGITMNHDGIHLRIPEIEAADKKKSLVFLSNSPVAIFRFLGMETFQYTPYTNALLFYEYIATCRFFSMRSLEVEPRLDALPNSRARKMLKRPVFEAWISMFLPTAKASRAYDREIISRQRMRDICFETFHVKKDYEEKLEVWEEIQKRNPSCRESKQRG